MLPRVVCGILALSLLLAGAPPAHGDVTYRMPVEGPVIRGFDPPAQPWGAGHRGVDLAAPPGTPVLAAADGTVSFAGTVVTTVWVSVAHADGVTTSYGPLAAPEVAAGQVVARGARLGTLVDGHHATASALHWGARRGEDYIDPRTLLGRGRPALVGPGSDRVTDLPDVPSYAPWSGRQDGWRGALGLVEPSKQAQGKGWPLAPNPNHVIAVSGLGSSTGVLPIEVAHLGYRKEDVTYLSYSGRDPTGTPGAGDQLPFGSEHTFAGVDAAARRLRDQLRAQWAHQPGQAVDLVGHSMGGVVILHYLLTLHDPADPTLPPIGHVATIASPLEGADAANMAVDAAADRLTRRILEGIGPLFGMPHPDDQALSDLAVGSPLVNQLASAWKDVLRDPWSSPLATGTNVLTLGASRDLAVPEHRSDLPGTAHVVLPGGHQGVKHSEAVRIVLYRFFADEPHPGEPGGAGHAASYLVSAVERLGGWILGGPGSWGD